MGARVIENWADVTGQVLETRPGQSDEYLELNLQIESAADVKGMANLVAPMIGKSMWVNIPCDLAQSLDVKAGDVLQARVRRLTAELAFVHNEYVTVHRLRMAAPPTTVDDAHAGEAELAETDGNDESSSTRTYAKNSQSSTQDQDNESVLIVLVEKGFRFYFYMADLINEPPHVHIDKDGNTAKFWLSPLRVSDPGRFSKKEIRQIERIVSQNEDELIRRWNAERAKIR